MIREYRRRGFEDKYRIFREGLSEDEAFRIEKERIEELGLRILGTGILTNISLGGEGSSGCSQTKSTKHRHAISKSKKGKKLSASHVEALSRAAVGRVISPETREKISKALSGRTKSKDHKEALSKAAKSKILSEETRRQMSERIRLIPKPDNAKWYEVRNPKGERFFLKNLAKFCRETGLSNVHLGQVALGKRNSHKGFTARFLTSDEVKEHSKKRL